MKNFTRTAITIGIAFFVIILPIISNAQSSVTLDGGLVQCDGIGEGKPRCGFTQLISGAQYLIQWMIMVAVPIATLVFAYAGVLFMFSSNESNISRAKGIFSKVLIGFFLMLAAWLIVHTLLSLLIDDKSFLLFFK